MFKTPLILPRITQFGSSDFAKLNAQSKGSRQTVPIYNRFVNRGLLI